MLSPFLLFFSYMVLAPLAVTVLYSFTDYSLTSASFKFAGLKNYYRLLRDDAFIRAFINTAYYTAVSVISLTALGFLTAAALNKSFKCVGFLRALMISPYATSMTCVSMIWLMMFDPFSGFINKALRSLSLPTALWLFDESMALNCLIFVNIWKNIGYCMLIYLAGMQAIPEELYEAATVDGAGERIKLFKITFPLIRPVMLFVLITTTISSFMTYDQVAIMTRGDPRHATTTIVHQIFTRGFAGNRMGYASAMAVVLIVAVLILTAFNYRLGRAEE
jgi:multiple sugar transport system permease protein/raffinose/stachyose/melibiose transport system permease protein